jgi:hypothetical protein
VTVGRDTLVTPPAMVVSGPGMAGGSGGVPGQIGVWTRPGEGCQTADRGPGSAAAELAHKNRPAAARAAP